VPNLAFPRPLPRPRGRRPTVAATADAAIDVAAPDIIEAAGIRWIHIESPRTVDRDWLEDHFDFHPLDYEDVYSRNNRPKLDQYDDYVFIVLHFPMFDKTTGRISAAELDLFMGPDYLITLPNIPLAPLNAMFERYREKDDLREATFSKGSGYLLYKIVDTCVDASFPMLRKMGVKLDELEDDIFEGRSSEIVRSISDTKQEIINFRRIVRPQTAVLRDLESVKQRYLQEELEIYFDDISDAAERIWDTLENYKEVIEALESTNESVLSHRLNDSLRVLTAVSVVLLPLTLIASLFGMNVPIPGQSAEFSFLGILAVMALLLIGMVAYFRRRGWL
jgi:magnesium transporter